MSLSSGTKLRRALSSKGGHAVGAIRFLHNSSPLRRASGGAGDEFTIIPVSQGWVRWSLPWSESGMPVSPDDLTLRDRVVVLLRLNRELIEHLEQGFVPKVHSLRRSTRPEKAGSDSAMLGDKTIHATAASVLESDHFTVGIYQKLIAHCESVRTTVQGLTGERIVRSGQGRKP